MKQLSITAVLFVAGIGMAFYLKKAAVPEFGVARNAVPVATDSPQAPEAEVSNPGTAGTAAAGSKNAAANPRKPSTFASKSTNPLTGDVPSSARQVPANLPDAVRIRTSLTAPADDEFKGFAALELAQQMAGMERIQMVREGISMIASASVDRAVAMANSLQDSHDHGVAVGSLVRIINETDPAMASAILFSRVPPETALGLLQYPRTAATMKQVMDTQTSQSPAGAIAWAGSFADPGDQVAASQMVAASWAKYSPRDAMTWAHALPAASREGAMAGIESVINPSTTAPAANSSQTN